MAAVLVSSPWGGRSNNCYVTLDEANSYITTAKIFYDEWLEFADRRLAALITGTQQIDANNWVGEQWFFNQLLEFPRYPLGEDFPLGSLARSDPDPAFEVLSLTDEYLRKQRLRVQIACCEQALWLLRNRGPSAHREDQFRGIRSQGRSGRISESFSYGDPDLILCPEAWDQLRHYVGATVLVRGDVQGPVRS